MAKDIGVFIAFSLPLHTNQIRSRQLAIGAIWCIALAVKTTETSTNRHAIKLLGMKSVESSITEYAQQTIRIGWNALFAISSGAPARETCGAGAHYRGFQSSVKRSPIKIRSFCAILIGSVLK
jgi:hypothetical protein